MDDALLRRIERLEAIQQIQQLAARYALAIDVRDLDALVALFVEDVQVGRERRGRAELKVWFDEILRHNVRETAHIVMNHVIELESADEAAGVVYCRAEHEIGPRFVVQQMQYWDAYSRRDGEWYFRRRIPLAWYATDLLDPPVGEKKRRWPGRPEQEAELPGRWESWAEYWRSPPPTPVDPVRAIPQGAWLAELRRKR